MSEANPAADVMAPEEGEEVLTERRAQPRLAVLDPADSEVLFTFPDSDGEPCAVPIHDVSWGGVSFRLTPPVLGIAPGWTGFARLRFGARVIDGDMLVVHVGANPEAGSICGAIFFAKSTADRGVLRTVVSELGRP